MVPLLHSDVCSKMHRDVMSRADMVPPHVELICNLIGLVSPGRANSIMKKRPWGGKKHGQWIVGHVVCSPGKEK